MCGITGAIWWDRARAISRDTAAAMRQAIRHRGPDDEGAFFDVISDGTEKPPASSAPWETTDAGVYLGHRRLSIIDLAGSRQPLFNEDASIVTVFNGEIYNYRELRQDLRNRGHSLSTDGDTEVLVHLYEEHGADMVRHLRGMFVFAIWDRGRNRLLLARDRLGQKPLFYRLEDGRLSFASELKSILQIPDLPRELNRDALLQYLTLQYVPHPHCMLEGFHKLPPATVAVFEEGRLSQSTYWTPPYDQPQHDRSRIEDWSDELRATLTESVRLRMRSDVPYGAFLSGGVDSTIICGLMQKQLDEPIRTFSIGFPVEAFDERKWARMSAEHLGTNHLDAVVEPDAISMLPDLIWHYDEPFSDSSAIPTMYLSRMTREHVKVALTGDAGDELFAGYDRYRAVRIAGMMDIVPGFLRRFAASMAAWLPGSTRQKSFQRRLKRLLTTAAEPPARRYLKWIAHFDNERLRGVVDESLLPLIDERDPARFVLDEFRRFPQRGPVTQTTAADLMTYLPGDLLTKVDIASMSCGLECRSPLLDHHVVELAARMPMSVKQTLKQGKRVFVETFRELIPAEVRSRPKMGFGVPIDHWFRNELRELLHDVLLDTTTLQRGLLNPGAVRLLIDQHTSGRFDHAYRLWNLLCLELWLRMYVDAIPPVSVNSGS